MNKLSIEQKLTCRQLQYASSDDVIKKK